MQKSIQKEGNNSENKLLERKALTEDNGVTVSFQKGGITHLPYVQEKTNGSKSQKILSIDKLAVEMHQQNQMDLLDGRDIRDIYEDVSEYFMSEEFNYDGLVTKGYVPHIIANITTQDDESFYIKIEDPFNKNNGVKILRYIANSELKAQLKRNDNGLYLELDDQETISLDFIEITDKETRPIEQTLIELCNRTPLWEHNNNKEPIYDGWVEQDVKSLDQTDFKKDIYSLKLSAFKGHEWHLSDPYVWDESSKTVRLIENFANGDPQQLDSVYVRPVHPYKDSEQDTIKSSDGFWEITVDEPKSNETQIIRELFVTIFLCLLVSLFAVLSYLLFLFLVL